MQSPNLYSTAILAVEPTQDGSAMYYSSLERHMNPLYGLLGAPTAATALDLVDRATKSAAMPFELFMQAAARATESTGAENESKQGADEPESLDQQVARQLQELLKSLGVEAGEQVTIEVDKSTSALMVGDDHPLAGAIEEALKSDPDLEEDVRRLAEVDDLFGAAPFAANSKLQVEVAEEGGSALLEWR